MARTIVKPRYILSIMILLLSIGIGVLVKIPERWFYTSFELIPRPQGGALSANTIPHERKDGIKRESIKFACRTNSSVSIEEKWQCDAWIYTPINDLSQRNDKDEFPIIIMAHGIGSTKDMGLDKFAKEFAKNGFMVLLFDYLYFGSSDGNPRHKIDPLQHVMDYESAIQFAQGIVNVDRQRIALYGTSYAGGHVLVTASKQSNVKAVISQMPFLGAMKSENPLDELVKRGLDNVLIGFLGAAASKIRQFIGMSPLYSRLYGHVNDENALKMALNWWEKFDGDEGKWLAKHPKVRENDWRNGFLADSLLNMVTYKPINYVKNIDNERTKVLIVKAKNDKLCPNDRMDYVIRHLNCESYMEDTTHFGMYSGEAFDNVIRVQIDFLAKHLNPVKILKVLDEGERKFIIDGVRCNIRSDGRQRLDVCPFEIEMNILPHCVCSAQVILHSTKIIIGLKLEVTSPDIALPNQGKIQCSVRYSPSSAPWKRNFELESMNFDLSRELQNIMSNGNDNGNGIDLSKLCILKNRLCWIVYIDALILVDNGNVFDALCLASTACFKHLRIPSLNIKNREQYITKKENESSMVDKESLFKNTEISKKAIISQMKQRQKQKTSKFSGQQLPFQDSVALNVSMTDNEIVIGQMDNCDIAEIEFVIECNKKMKTDFHFDLLPIVITMAIMDNNEYFVVDPLFEEEICCDVIVRIAVYSNGNISVIKYGEKAINPLLIFDMIESAKKSGLKWMNVLDEKLKQNDENDVKESESESNLSTFELNKMDEKEVEIQMMKELKCLSFVTNNDIKIDVSLTKSSKIDKAMQNIQLTHKGTVETKTVSFKQDDDGSDMDLSNDEQMIDID